MKTRPTHLLHTSFCLVRHLSTSAKTASEGTVRKDSLYRRLSGLNATGETATKKLNEYIMEGKTVTKSDLLYCIRIRRKYGEFDQALEIMEWMEKKEINYSFSEYALRLDLIAKNKGVTAAEDYFNGLPEFAKSRSTYGALFHCYCNELMADKALDLFKKMDEMKFLHCALPFNDLMNLHLKMNQPEKALACHEEMKQKNISPDSFTYQMRMRCFACLNDLEGAERVLDEMKRNDKGKIDWNTYCNMAVHYVNAGLFEKAESALKEAEAIVGPQDREAYHFLISLYAATSNLNEVKRVWDSLKTNFRTITNGSYLVIFHALARLKDIKGLTKCFKKWESSCTRYDMRLTDVVIRVCLEHNMHEEAARIFDDALTRCTGSFFKAREMFMVFYLRNDQLDLALNHLLAAFSEVEENRKWQPREETVRAFLYYFEKQKDVQSAEKFCKILKHIKLIDTNAYIHLLKTYVAAGRPAPEMRSRLEEDGVEISDELENLLDKVC